MEESPSQPRSKGDRSRARMVERAYRVATRVGLQGLTIGELATELGVSKSGLFAHFGSKENLQLAVLDFAAEDFRRRVFEPALRQPRGLPRLMAVFEAWLDWAALRERGGCIFLSSAAEYDDQEGPVRDRLVAWFEALYRGLERTFALAIAEKHLADVEPAQLVSEMHGIVLKFHLDARLLRRVGARDKARTAFSRVLDGARRKEPS